MKENKINKFLLQKVKAKPLNILHTNMQLKSEIELKINQAQPTYAKTGLKSNMLSTYLETRAGMHGGNKGEQIACPYCPGKPQHTYTHCINECKFDLCTRTREIQQMELEQQGLQLQKATIDNITEAITTEYHKDLPFLLAMIKSSPYL
jgi:hypothetical protein